MVTPKLLLIRPDVFLIFISTISDVLPGMLEYAPCYAAIAHLMGKKS
jgi:hypothetical protein